MIAGFTAIIVLIEAPVLTRPQSSSCNARREQGVITPLVPLRRDRDDRERASIRLIFNDNNNINSDESLSNLKIIYDCYPQLAKLFQVANTDKTTVALSKYKVLKKKKVRKANCSGDLRVPPVKSWFTRIGTPFVDAPFCSSKRVFFSWFLRTHAHHWHLNTKTSLADRSEERRLCSRVRETRRSAIVADYRTKNSLRFLGQYSVSRREITPSLSGDNPFNNHTCTKLTTHGKNLFDSSKRYVATKTASFQLQKWNTS